MNSFEEKLFLMKQLIEFAKIDGLLHDKEMDFLLLLAEDFGIDKVTYFSLFNTQEKIVPISFNDKIIQFYRLALLMQSDGFWHEKEITKIHEIGIMMGLNPSGIDKLLLILKKMGPNYITSELLSNLFTVQLN